VCSNALTYFAYDGSGAGAVGAVLNNCLIFNNTAVRSGGGAAGCTLNNCTVAGNTAGNFYTGGYGRGADGCVINDCIITANNGDDIENSVLRYTCTTADQPGPGNFTADPLFVNGPANDFHLQSGSPCINSGEVSVGTTTDFDGHPRVVGSAVDLGAYEYQTVIPFTCAIVATDTNVVIGFPLSFSATFSGGHPSASTWDFGNGSFYGNQLPVTNAWGSPGDYPVRLTVSNPGNPGGISATVAVHVVTQVVHYVAQNGTNAIAPYLSWDTAATNIQDAVDAAYVGGVVLVTNGNYSGGSRIVNGVTNRVATSKYVRLASVNGAAVTTINGVGGATRVRGVYLAAGTSLAGFTVANGRTLAVGDSDTQLSGGGVWCETANEAISNCVFNANAAFYGGGAFRGNLWNCTFNSNLAGYGGGAFNGTLDHCGFFGNSATNGGGVWGATLTTCILSNNTAMSGGGASDSWVSNCVTTANVATNGGGVLDGTIYGGQLVNNFAIGNGGGSLNSTLYYCLVTNNVAGNTGGGVFQNIYYGTLYNCVIAGNTAGSQGGGAFGYFMYNALVDGNSAPNGGGAAGCNVYNCTVTGNSSTNAGGVWSSTCFNSIVYGNLGGNYDTNGSSLNNCCTAPLPESGFANFTLPPLFVNPAAADFHLQASSPCINAGYNFASYSFAYPGTIDLDGNPRIVGGTIDVGAYEYQTPASVLSYAWAQQYGLATDGSADHADPDHDGLDNYAEWRSLTNPTNAASVLRVLSPSITTNAPGITVNWQGVYGVTYFVQRGTNLMTSPVFTTIQDGIIGQDGVNSWQDESADPTVNYFYRVGVQ
jgi:hypothetical protein